MRLSSDLSSCRYHTRRYISLYWDPISLTFESMSVIGRDTGLSKDRFKNTELYRCDAKCHTSVTGTGDCVVFLRVHTREISRKNNNQSSMECDLIMNKKIVVQL